MSSADLANALAGFAIFISVVSFIANIFYTRRTYHAATRPALQAVADINSFTGGVPALPQSYFSLFVTNLSATTSAANVRVRIFAIRPAQSRSLDWIERQIRLNKPILLREWGPAVSLGPGAYWHGGQAQVGESIERKLAANLPDLLRLIDVTEPGRPLHLPQPDGQQADIPVAIRRNYFEMPVARTIYLRLAITFETGAGSKAVTRCQDFTLSPTLGPVETPQRLQGWRMRRVVRHLWSWRLPREMTH